MAGRFNAEGRRWLCRGGKEPRARNNPTGDRRRREEQLLAVQRAEREVGSRSDRRGVGRSQQARLRSGLSALGPRIRSGVVACSRVDMRLRPRCQPAERSLLVDVIAAVPAQVERRQPVHQQDVQDQQQLREPIRAHAHRTRAL